MQHISAGAGSVKSSQLRWMDNFLALIVAFGGLAMIRGIRLLQRRKTVRAGADQWLRAQTLDSVQLNLRLVVPSQQHLLVRRHIAQVGRGCSLRVTTGRLRVPVSALRACACGWAGWIAHATLNAHVVVIF